MEELQTGAQEYLDLEVKLEKMKKSHEEAFLTAQKDSEQRMEDMRQAHHDEIERLDSEMRIKIAASHGAKEEEVSQWVNLYNECKMKLEERQRERDVCYEKLCSVECRRDALEEELEVRKRQRGSMEKEIDCWKKEVADLKTAAAVAPVILQSTSLDATGLEEQVSNLNAILKGRDEEIKRLENVVHKECKER